MISAVEAREKSKQRLEEIATSQLQEIESLVLDACENGDFFISYDKPLKGEVQKVLRESGYNIEDDGKIIEWEFLDEVKDQNQKPEDDIFNEVNFDDDSVEDSPELAEKEESVEDSAEAIVETFEFEDEPEDESEEKTEDIADTASTEENEEDSDETNVTEETE